MRTVVCPLLPLVPYRHYMPGMVAKQHNPVIIAMAKRLEKKGLAPKAIVGASMRKLVHLIYGVIKSGQPF